MAIEFRKIITRDMLRAEPGTLFVFGDNLLRVGLGGQAKEMRGEPNAVGIPTKKAPRNSDDAFFSDEDFDTVKPELDAAFAVLEQHLSAGGRVVWPSDGVGTGFAALPSRAPAIWSYLEQRRTALDGGDAA